jgi:hypothetical protein
MAGFTASPVFETALAMVFLWFVAATLSSGIVELIATALGFRANHLWQVLGRLLAKSDQPADPGSSARVAAQLTRKPDTSGTALPAFIEALPGVTASAIKRVRRLDPTEAAQAFVAIKDDPDVQETQLGQLVRRLPASIKDEPERLVSWLERWFNGEMEATSRAYKRRIRWWAVVASAFVVGGVGIDSLALAAHFYKEPSERAAVIAAIPKQDAPLCTTTTTTTSTVPAKPGTTQVRPTPTSTTTSSSTTTTTASATTTTTVSLSDQLRCLKTESDTLFALHVSSWQHTPKTCRGWLWLTVGLLGSWLAIAAGAPFWFAVLKRMMSLRSSNQTSSS